MYGLEYVNWKTTTLEQLYAFQNHTIRYILNKRQQEHITITKLLAKTKHHSISSKAKSQILKLCGHVKNGNQQNLYQRKSDGKKK